MTDHRSGPSRVQRAIAFAKQRPFEVILAVALLFGVLVSLWPIADKVPDQTGRYLAWLQEQERCVERPVFDGRAIVEPNEASEVLQTPRYSLNDEFLRNTGNGRLVDTWNAIVGGYYTGSEPPDLPPSAISRLSHLGEWHTPYLSGTTVTLDGERHLIRELRWNFNDQTWDVTYQSGAREVCTSVRPPEMTILLEPAVPEGIAVAAVVFVTLTGLILARRALNKPTEELHWDPSRIGSEATGDEPVGDETQAPWIPVFIVSRSDGTEFIVDVGSETDVEEQEARLLAMDGVIRVDRGRRGRSDA